MINQTYVALLRGINVGGKGKVSMGELKTCFEGLGFKAVKTYINSGNVVFIASDTPKVLIVKIEQALNTTLKLPISVVVKSLAEVETVLKGVPKAWHDNKDFRHYIMFLRPGVDKPAITNELKVNSEMEEVQYVPGAVLWSAKITELGHSKMQKIIGSKLYKEITVRNLNTTIKVHELMKAATL